LQILVAPLTTLLVLRGHTRLASSITWMEFVVFLLAAAGMVPHFGLVGLAYARLVSTTVNAVLCCLHAHNCNGIAYLDIVRILYRPLVGAALIAGVGAGCGNWFDSPILHVVTVVALGLPAYAAWCATAWVLSGRPEGLESTVADRWQAWRSSNA
jgi:O-antigen/teichoic acid export membrane protein